MDYKSKTMTVLKKSELANRLKTVSLSFELAGPTHIMIVRSEINGKEAYLHFDTGGTFSLNLFSPKVKELGLKVEKRVEGGRGGAGQEVTQIFYKQPVKTCLAKICEIVKPIAIEGQESMWAPINKIYGKEISGQISHQFFADKKVEYDLPEKRILILAE